MKTLTNSIGVLTTLDFLMIKSKLL